MTTVPICFSILQVSRFRFHAWGSIWRNSFQTLGRPTGNSTSFKLLGSKIQGPEGGYNKRWTRRPVSTKTEGKNKTTQSNKLSSVSYEIINNTVSRSTMTNIDDTKVSQFQNGQYCDIQQLIAEKKDLTSLITVIVFDIETTGLSRENERIIEIALQDLVGGDNSTFQTLINPERHVPNAYVHGITTQMVNRSHIPRMEDLIPILLQYIRSRQKPGGYILWVAHNARCFDVPFLIKEFERCSFEIPPNWLFLDTLALARELMKSGGLNIPSKISLQGLREHYQIPLIGSAHRAMSDVNSLAFIFQRITFDLKLPMSALVERTFNATSLKKKKNSS